MLAIEIWIEAFPLPPLSIETPPPYAMLALKNFVKKPCGCYLTTAQALLLPSEGYLQARRLLNPLLKVQDD